MSKSRRGITAALGIVLVSLLAVLVILSWNAGGPQEMHEITQPVPVPELPR